MMDTSTKLLGQFRDAIAAAGMRINVHLAWRVAELRRVLNLA